MMIMERWYKLHKAWRMLVLFIVMFIVSIITAIVDLLLK